MRISVIALPLLIACSGGEDPSDAIPTPPADFGPENTWWHATEDEVPPELQGTGRRVGDTMADFTFVDQFGDEVQLYQFYGQVVQLILFAQWCTPCQEEAPLVEATWQDLEDDGVVILGVMMEGNDGPTTPEHLDQWAVEYSATHPLLNDSSQTLNNLLQGGYPTLPVLDRELTIRTLDNFPFDPQYLADLAAE